MFQKENKSRVNMIENERHGLDTGELSCFIEYQDTTPIHKVDLQLFVYSSFNDSLFMAIKSSNKEDLRANTDKLIKEQKIRIKIGELEFLFIADSESVFLIVPRWMAKKIVETCNKPFWDPDESPPAVKTYNHGSIQTYGTLVTNLLLIGLQVEDAYIQVTDNGLKPILGRVYLKKLGLRITQERYGSKLSGDNKKVFGRVPLERKTGKQIQRSFHEKGILKKLSSYELPRNDMEVKLPEIIKTSLEECELNLKLVNKLGGLLTKEGIARNFPVRSKLYWNILPPHTKKKDASRLIYRRVEKELKYLQDIKQLNKLNKRPDKKLVWAIVITVKRDESIKLAFDSTILIKAIHKNIYQLPNIDILMNCIAEEITRLDKSSLWF